MGILAWLVFGLIAGAIAKFLMPGKAPGGIILTIALGIVGAVVGGFIGTHLLNLGGTSEFDLRSMAGSTEELWFPLWEFRGMPWDNPDLYAKWSPSFFVKDFKTPTLVFHGELDYRVPVEQGMQLFTALQMQKVPSKLVIFPDEGHWILKPQNSQLWYTQFLDWVGEWTKKSN